MRKQLGTYREAFSTGAVTGIAAGDGTAGHLLGIRNKTTKGNIIAILRALEVEFLLTTAFTAAQEVGFSAFIARAYTAPHTGQTTLSIGGGRQNVTIESPKLTGSIANAGALTAGTQTLNTNPVARGSAYCSAVGAQISPRRYDFLPFGGYEFADEEGLVVSNLIAMGAAGVGKWHFTLEWDEYRIDA